MGDDYKDRRDAALAQALGRRRPRYSQMEQCDREATMALTLIGCLAVFPVCVLLWACFEWLTR